MLGNQAQESPELLLLALEVRVEQRLVPLAAAPKDVVRTAESLRDLEHDLDLRGRVGEDLGIRVGGRARRVARMAEQVGGAPQQPDAGSRHVALGLVDDRVQVRGGLGEGRSIGRHIPIVERIEGRTELLEEFERSRELQASRGHRLHRRSQPRAVECPDTEDIGARPVERVPVTDGDAEVIFHPFPEHDSVWVVDLERKGIVRSDPSERDATLDLGEEFLRHPSALRAA